MCVQKKGGYETDVNADKAITRPAMFNATLINKHPENGFSNIAQIASQQRPIAVQHPSQTSPKHLQKLLQHRPRALHGSMQNALQRIAAISCDLCFRNLIE